MGKDDGGCVLSSSRDNERCSAGHGCAEGMIEFSESGVYGEGKENKHIRNVELQRHNLIPEVCIPPVGQSGG